MQDRPRMILIAFTILVLILIYIQPDVQLEEWEGDDEPEDEG
jgi:hypothetical protein